MPTFQEWFQQHKVAIYVGAGATGIVVFVILSRGSSQGRPRATLDTLDDDLQSIDKRLQAENAYLSSSASMSPLSPEIDIMTSMQPGPRTPSQPVPAASSTSAPVTSSTARTTAVSAPSPGHPETGQHKTATKKKKKGRGGQIDMQYADNATFGYGGDTNDYWGLN